MASEPAQPAPPPLPPAAERRPAGPASLDAELVADLLSDASAALVVWTLGGGVRSWNGAAERLYGHTAAEASGRRLHELLESRFPESLAATERALGAEGAWSGTLLQKARDGRLLLVASRMRAARLPDGGVAVLETCRALQDRLADDRSDARPRPSRAPDLERARLLGLAERVDEIELMMRLDGQIVEVNDRAVAAYGRSREALLGLHIRDLRAPSGRPLMVAQMAEALAHGVRFETEHLRADGRPFPVEVSSRAFVVGGETYLHSLVRDLTESRLAQQRRRLLDRVVESMGDGVIVADASLRVTEYTGASERIYGWTRAEALGKNLATDFRCEFPLGDAAGVDRMLAAGAPFRTRVRALRKDGTWADLDLAVTPLPDLDGRVQGWLSVARDIGAQVAAERAAEALAREQDVLLQTAQVGISKVVDRRQVWVNRRALEMFGYAREEMVGQTTRMLYRSQEAYEAFGRDAYPVLASGRAYQSDRELLRKDGTRIWVRYNGMAIDPTDLAQGTLWTLEDVTARREAEQRLAESEEQLRSTFSAMAEGVVVIDAAGRITSCNEAAERILGLSRAQMEGRTPVDPRWRAVHEDGSPFPGEEHPVMVTLRTGRALSGVVMGVDAPGAGRRWISLSSQPLRRAPEAPPHAVVTTFGDITEERAARERLAAREAQLDRVVAASTDGFVEWDPGTGLVDRSARTLQLVGLEPGQVAPTVEAWFELLHPDDAPSLKDALRELAEGARTTLFREYRMRHADGSWRWLLLRARRRQTGPTPDRFIVSGTVSDVTERREAQARVAAELTRNEALVLELREALAHVKTLSGLLPICMHCHKIRDDSGYWSRIESYISQRSEAVFSHGLCPECEKSHYP